MEVELRRIHVGDASGLRDAGLLAGTLASIEDELRAFIKSQAVDCMVAISEKEFVAVVKMFLPDRRQCRVHLDFIFREKEPSRQLCAALFDSLLKYCFTEEFYHKVTITISSKNAFLEPVIADCGFVQEAVLRDEIKVPHGFEDAGLFSMLSADYMDYNVCFVSFDMGVAEIGGGEDFIDYVKLHHYKDTLDNLFAQNIAGHMGYLDDRGRLIEDRELYDLDDGQLATYPAEVAKAYVELKQYFSKRRSEFDLNLRFNRGTDFQRSVWDAVREIKYGSINFYETIAEKIADSPQRARNLTRAVGAACSENPLAIVVPCHRVIGKDMTLVGYSAGTDIKDFLLTHEAFTTISPIKSEDGE